MTFHRPTVQPYRRKSGPPSAVHARPVPPTAYGRAVLAFRRTQAAVLPLILAVGLSTPARAAGPVDWPHPGYDAEDSYYNPHESAINLSTIGHLARRWTVPLRKQAACAGFSAPLVAAGRVIATDQYGISAYNASTGAASWHFDWPDPVGTETPSMAVDGSTLIAATTDCFSQSDPDGTIVALDLAGGRVRWRVDSDAPAFSLVVDKGMAVVWGESPSDERATVAYRVVDGKVAWRKPGYQSSNVSADGRVLLTDTHHTSAVSITNGVPLWTRTGYWQAKAATPASDRFLVTNGQSLSAISAAWGAVSRTARGGSNDLLATDGRRVFRVVGRVIDALSMASGHGLWSRVLPKPLSQPVRAGGLLYLGGPVLDPATRAQIAPTYSGNEILLGGRLVIVGKGVLSSFGPNSVRDANDCVGFKFPVSCKASPVPCAGPPGRSRTLSVACFRPRPTRRAVMADRPISVPTLDLHGRATGLPGPP
jgi:outer membrane protein assembly factor BamB